MRSVAVVVLLSVGVCACKDETPVDHPLIDEERLEEVIERYRADPDYDPQATTMRRRVDRLPDEPVPPTRSVDEAMEAYRAIVADHDPEDPDRYYAHFADPVGCFFGRTGLPLPSARNSRWARLVPGRGIVKLQPITSTDRQVELVEYGWTGRGIDRTAKPHALRVRLERAEDDAWRITHLALDQASLCGEPNAEAPVDPFYAALERSWTALQVRCEGREHARGPCAAEHGLPDLEALCRPRLGCGLSSEMPCPRLAACTEHLQATLDRFVGAEGEAGSAD